MTFLARITGSATGNIEIINFPIATVFFIVCLTMLYLIVHQINKYEK